MDASMVEITIISADGLKNVRKLGGRMHTYAVVCSGDDVYSSASTRIDKDGGCNPVWNEKLQLGLNRGLNVHSLDIQIYCTTSFGKRAVGWTKVPLSDITSGFGGSNGLHYLSYRLKTKKGKRSGTIDLSLRFLTQLFNPSISKFPGQGSCQNNPPFSNERHEVQQNTAVIGVPSTWMGYPSSSAPFSIYPPPQY